MLLSASQDPLDPNTSVRLAGRGSRMFTIVEVPASKVALPPPQSLRSPSELSAPIV